MPKARSLEHRRKLREPLSCPRPRFHRLGFAISRRARRLQRVQQPAGSIRNFVDCALERRSVRLRRAVEPADFTDELQCRSLDLVLGSKLNSARIFRHIGELLVRVKEVEFGSTRPSFTRSGMSEQPMKLRGKIRRIVALTIEVSNRKEQPFNFFSK